MSRTIDAGTAAQIAAGQIIKREMVRFDLPSGTIGFWSGVGPLTYSSVDYQGKGALFQIESIGGSLDGSAIPLRIRLAANADLGLDARDLVNGIEAEDYAGAGVVVSRAYFDPSDRSLLSVETLWRGYVDTIKHVSEGGEAYAEATCESRMLDLGRAGYRMRTDADQRQRSATDGSLRHVQAAASVPIVWGRATPARA